MKSALRSLLCSFFLISLCAWASAQTCGTYTFTSNDQFSNCVDLPVLNSFLHWTYNNSTGSANIAFRRPGTSSDLWISWAINPTGQNMAGAQALVAYQNSSGVVHPYTSPITGYETRLEAGSLSFAVPSITASYVGNEMIIFATLELGTGMTSVNHLWQEGPLSGGSPLAHASNSDNLNSKGTLDLLSGSSVSASNSRTERRNVHGVLNAVGWGILLPMGAIFARYLKVFKSADPAWFYLHVACQTSAYVVGVAGWATGMKLRSDFPGQSYSKHRNIGITLFTLGTLQVFALLLRPKKDHKYRFYWNIYHHSIGYSVIVLSILNIYEGFDILNVEDKWKRAYSGVLIFLGACALILEAFTWFIVIKRKKESNEKNSLSENGANGHTGRPHNVV